MVTLHAAAKHRRWLVYAALLLVVPAARATMGGPQTLEVLGFQSDEARVYLLRHAHDQSGDPPRLLYYRLDDAPPEQAPDQPVVVQSWYEGDLRAVHDALPGRLAGLSARLVPLERRELVDLALTVTWRGRDICPQQKEQTRAADREAVLAHAERAGGFLADPEDPGSALVSVCDRVDVAVRWEGQEAATTLHTWGGVEVVGLWRVPERPEALVVLQHTGVTYEVGYAAQVPLLLAPGAAPLPEPAPPTSNVPRPSGGCLGQPGQVADR